MHLILALVLEHAINVAFPALSKPNISTGTGGGEVTPSNQLATTLRPMVRIIGVVTRSGC